MQQRVTYYEREVIEVELRKGASNRAIARKLHRDHRVIDREIERNSGEVMPYTAASAQRIACRHERERTRKKLEKNHELKAYVVAWLREDHSPEQIAGRLKAMPHPELSGKTLCHETIYQYIYAGEGRYEYLYPHLRKGRPKRRKQKTRKSRKITIPERISIHERPEEATQKIRVGHWESDTMLVKKQLVAGSVQYERKSQLLRLHKVKNRTAEETEYAIRDTISSLPQDLFRTMTFDNGKEGVRHTNIRDDYGIETYFCDAYASWQKGGVENMNGLLRQYIPKDANLSKMTDEDMYAIQEKLNNRPRKGLNYLTPNEVIAQEVGH
jgi:IS30 family transposase